MEEIAIKIFKLGLDPESELRHNFSRRPAKSMKDLMSRIDQFVRVEDDRARTRVVSTQGQPPRKLANTEQRRTKLPAKNLAHFTRPRELGGVHTVFNEPIYRIMVEIKKRTFFLVANSLGQRSIKERP
jgi:hypothetical protein